jgi:hypothetical protein
LAATEKSATAALIGDAGSDQIARDLAQQMLRERARTTEAKALQFEKVFGEAAHGDLSVIRGLKRGRRGWRKTFSCDESIGERHVKTNQPALNLT